MRDADRPWVAQLLAHCEREFVHRSRLIEVALALGDECKVAEQAADAGGVAETFADLETALIRVTSRGVLALLRCERSLEV